VFHKDKLQTSITTLTPYGVCGKIYGETDLKSGILGAHFFTRFGLCDRCHDRGCYYDPEEGQTVKNCEKRLKKLQGPPRAFELLLLLLMMIVSPP
jgi:hypothetical protein